MSISLKKFYPHHIFYDKTFQFFININYLLKLFNNSSIKNKSNLLIVYQCFYVGTVSAILTLIKGQGNL